MAAVFFRTLRVTLHMLVAAVILSGCGNDSTATNDPGDRKRAATLMPADQDLADLYAQTCKSCHSVAIGGAPLTGSEKDWLPRLAKGEDVLLENTINGYGGMPPLGACTDCDEDDFRALIRFMAEAE